MFCVFFTEMLLWNRKSQQSEPQNQTVWFFFFLAAVWLKPSESSRKKQEGSQVSAATKIWKAVETSSQKLLECWEGNANVGTNSCRQPAWEWREDFCSSGKPEVAQYTRCWPRCDGWNYANETNLSSLWNYFRRKALWVHPTIQRAG